MNEDCDKKEKDADARLNHRKKGCAKENMVCTVAIKGRQDYKQ